MLRVSEFKKSPHSLGDPVGREVCVKYENRKDLSAIYVKYGRELVKFTDFNKKWNVTVFDSALNQPTLPWIVVPRFGEKKIAVNTIEKGLKLFGENDSKGQLLAGGDATKTSQFTKPDSSVHLMSFNTNLFAMTLDDDHLVQMYNLSKEKLTEIENFGIYINNGQILPVVNLDGNTEYLAHGIDEKITVYSLSTGKKIGWTSKLKTSCTMKKLFITNKKELLHISNVGLHIFTVDGKQISLSYFCTNFSENEGWTDSFYETIQLVKIDNEEVLISTGPTGIQVVKISNDSKVYTIQDDPKNVKHVTIGNAVSKGTNQVEVTGYYNTEVYTFTLTLEETKPIPEPTMEDPQETAQPEPLQKDPNFQLSNNNFVKPTRWLANTLDESHFKNTVNKLTGRVELAFPLVDLQDRFGIPIKLMAYYQEEQTAAGGVLGRHWTLGKDCIVLDYKGSVFEEIHEYFLVKDQVRIKLIKGKDEQGKVKYEVEGKKELSIEYHKNEEKWIASNGEVKYIYGVKGKGIISIPVSDNWYGPAAKYKSNRNVFTIQWNLIEINRNSDENVHIEFKYEAQENNHHVMHLKNIKDSVGTNITLSYSKITDQLKNPYKLDNDKKVVNREFYNTQLLSKIDIETSSFTQKLVLKFKNIANFQYFHELIQSLKSKTYTVLKFDYTENEPLVKLNQVQLPSNNVLKYEYKKESIDSKKFQQDIGKLVDFFTGPGYSIKISLINQMKTLQIDFKDNAGFNNFIKQEQLTITESNQIKSYRPVLLQKYFAIIVNVSENKSKGKNDNAEEAKITSKIYIFDKEETNVWKQHTQKFAFEHLENDPFHSEFQDDMIIYFDAEKINFIHMDSITKKWTHLTKKVDNALAVTFFKKGAVYYSNGLFLIRWNSENKITNPAKIESSKHSPTMHSWKSFFDHIELQAVDPTKSNEKDTEKYRKQFSRIINGSSMIMFNNLLAVRTIDLNSSGKIKLKLHLYLLNKEYSVVNSQVIEIPGEDISEKEFKFQALDEFRYEKVNVNDLEDYTFKFSQENDKFKLKFQHSTNIKTNKTVQPSEKQREQITIMERMMKIPLDFERYTLQVNSDGIICGNHLIYHDGDTFKSSPMNEMSLKLEEFQFPVGDYSALKKASAADKVKFCTKSAQTSEKCTDLQTTSARNVSVKYPNYLISQNKDNTWVHVLNPDGRGIQETVSFPREMVHRSSSHSAFVSTKLGDNSTHVRPFRSISKTKVVQVEVVSKESLEAFNEVHSISYEYQNPVLSDAQVMFKTTLVIPGSDKKRFGFYQESIDFITNDQVVQVRDNKGNLFDPEYLKRMNEVQEEQKRERNEPALNTTQMILDRSAMLPILDVKPYVGEYRSMIDFLSFEDYEKEDGWTITKGTIVQNGFSATGRNYLKLKSGQTITKNFNELLFEGDFVFSAWIRTTKSIKIGESINSLTLQAKNAQIKGVVKQRINDWYYIEANTTTLNIPKSSKSKINLTVKIQSSDAELHVDHVRFTPLNFNFEARVYDSRTSQRVATIHSNGFVSRFLQDDYGRRIAEIDENGNIKYFASYSKKLPNTAGRSVEGNRSSRIHIKPKNGLLETFSPYTAGSRWKPSKSQLVEPGKIRLNGELTYKGNLDSDALGIRMMYNLLSSGKLTVKIAGRTITISSTEVTLNTNKSRDPPKQGELIILATSYLTSVWIEGSVILEEQSSKSRSPELSISAQSDVEIQNLIVLESPQVVVTYLNYDSKPIQEIMLEDGSNILIRQLIYDEIGRKSTETVWTRIPISELASKKRGYLAYQNDFVSNGLSSNEGKMTGPVHDYNKPYDGYPYSQTLYYPNPLEIRHKVTQPGELYSIAKKAKFQHTFSINSTVPFINSNYPPSEGYRCEEEVKPNGMKHVTVYNRRNKKAAEYISVKDYKNVLTTYLYDKFGNQIQMIPPKFYETTQSGNLNPLKKKDDTPWAVNSEYDKEGKLLKKRSTPDGGLVEFIYDDHKQLRCQLHYNEANKVDKIVYFLYNLSGQVYETGKLDATSIADQKFCNDVTVDVPDRSHVINFDYGETDPDPALRGRIQRVVKQNGDLQFKQVLYYDEDGNVLRKSYLSSNPNETLTVDYLRENDLVAGIRYPIFVKGKQLVLKYGHNLRGEVTSIGLVENESEVTITRVGHDPQGKVTEISHKYENNIFDQSFTYEAPGYLKTIESPYLQETLYYTEKGYGATPVGDGSILRTEFHAKWHDQCDQNLIPLTARALISDKINIKMAETCFDALLKRGYFDKQGRPLKSYYPDLEKEIPVECSTGSKWKDIATGILEHGYPEHYGHAYDYGSHSELVAAKYFVGDERIKLKISKSANGLPANRDSALGNSPGDVESFSIDSNGNHETYYTGFNRFKLTYKNNNNQISTIQKDSTPYTIDHDSEGNIIAAPHKGIDQLEYDPLTQRVSRIVMPNKKLIIEFGYDHLGERILKRVRNAAKDILSELYYVRDNNGNTLVEYKLTYPNPKEPSKPIVTITAYIYGPLGLVGFFRNDRYYSVLLDHEGSVRLVLHRNRVVAAYDYMPYGQLMRKFGSSSEAHISYRYTGQEFDEESGLYNYHARLYDPDIGRFYQLDPMEQYPSPYKYAGNSPVSQIDPDGQIAISLIIIGIGALVGAYLGAASANNSWDPAQWDWANKKTWIGMFAGALAGGFAAYGGIASLTYLAPLFGGSMLFSGIVTGMLAAGGAFLGSAAATNEWNPRKWDWTSPIVWNGLLTGTAVAVSLPSGFVGISRTFFSLVSNAAKIIYGSTMISGFLLLGYVGGAFANNFNFRMDQWDWKSPRTWFGIVEGSATVIMATGGTVKHGAFKTHFITSPGKLKGAWYRINIPAQSFTVKETPWKFFITYYKNGQKVGTQIIDITTRKGLRSIPQYWQGTTKYFFISNGRIAAGMVAVGSYTFAKHYNYKSLFEQYPNQTQKIGVKAQNTRSKRYALDFEAPASNSASREKFFSSLLDTLKQFLFAGNVKLDSISDVAPIPLKNNFKSELFTEKLCYSPKDQSNHFICPQRKSTVNVYSKSDSFQPETFGQDSFGNCFPINWHGYPSVACDGQESTFIYTPREQLRVFDLVDGWLLLARVTPAVWRSAKDGIRFLKTVFSKNQEKCVQQDELYANLREEFGRLQSMIRKAGTDKSKWINPMLEDLEEDFIEIEKSRGKSRYQLDILQDRIDAVREDFLDDLASAFKISMSGNLAMNVSNKQGLNWLQTNDNSTNQSILNYAQLTNHLQTI